MLDPSAQAQTGPDCLRGTSHAARAVLESMPAQVMVVLAALEHLSGLRVGEQPRAWVWARLLELAEAARDSRFDKLKERFRQ